MSETRIGVVDRIVDGKTAVLQLEDDGEPIDQLDVPLEQLPDKAQRAGGVLAVTVEEGEYVRATYLADETARRREAARKRLDRLSRPLSEKDE